MSKKYLAYFLLTLSVFYIACTYENVYDLGKIEDHMETTLDDFDDVAYMKWKNEYANPLVIGKGKRHEKTAMERVLSVSRESQIGNLDLLNSESDTGADGEKYESKLRRDRGTGLFELTTHKRKKRKPVKEQAEEDSVNDMVSLHSS